MTQLDINSSAVHNYINNLQSAINRMASNSASSKTWCITLVSAIIVFATDEKRNPDSIWISLIPICLFCFLDAYYLGLERLFRNLYNSFVQKLVSNQATNDDLYKMTPAKTGWEVMGVGLKSMASLSILPFYGFMIILLIAIRTWLP